MLVVHGRCREHKKQFIGPANWTMIRKIKQALSIPVFANGGISTYKDVVACLEYTGCDGVMSSEAILEYPALFDDSKLYDMDELVEDFLEMVIKYPGESDIKNVRSHLHKFLHAGLKVHTDLRDRIAESKSLDELKAIAAILKERRIAIEPYDKLGWYYRYFISLNLFKEETPLSTTQEWDEQIFQDPLFNKALRKEASVNKQDLVVNDNVLG